MEPTFEELLMKSQYEKELKEIDEWELKARERHAGEIDGYFFDQEERLIKRAREELSEKYKIYS